MVIALGVNRGISPSEELKGKNEWDSEEEDSRFFGSDDGRDQYEWQADQAPGTTLTPSLRQGVSAVGALRSPTTTPTLTMISEIMA